MNVLSLFGAPSHQEQSPAASTKLQNEVVQKKLSSKVYALIIGINSYSNLGPKAQNLTGAVADADAMAEFLIEDLKVPSDHITNLRNESATREAIINAIMDLSKDTRIEKGNPIVIYFAGHGGEANVSDRWKAITGADKIQAICPYDQGEEKSNKKVYPIPDRTIRALVNSLSREKGDNISLIFDSCHSASANRQRSDGPTTEVRTFRARGAEITMEIPDDIDLEFITNEEDKRPGAGGSRGTLPLFTDQASHVFLAACGSKDFAWEEGNRGLFTTTLLATIRANDVDNITYENLLAALPRLPYDQSPHCSGSHKSRILFNACVPTRRVKFRPVEKDDEGNWVLQAGASSGVMYDSVWALHEAPTEKSVSLGTLCASMPKTSTTLLESKGTYEIASVPDETKRLFARQVQAGVGHEMKVFYTPEAERLLHPTNTMNRAIPGSWNTIDEADTATNEFRHVIVQTQEEADMVVDVYREDPGPVPEITFTMRESPEEIYPLPLLTKRVSAKRDEVDAVLSKAAGWNWTLKYENPSAVTDPIVSLQFLKLRESPDGPIKRPFVDLNEDGVVRIHIKPNEEPEYGIRLTNLIDRELHVRVLYFDVPNFAILELGPQVTANGRKDAEIPKKGEYLIGDTADGGQSMTFGIAEPGKVETGFIKVVWSTAPFELDTGKERRPIVKDTRGKELPEVWGTLVAKLVLNP